jgi:hypothetical protein
MTSFRVIAPVCGPLAGPQIPVGAQLRVRGLLDRVPSHRSRTTDGFGLTRRWPLAPP